MKDLGWTEKIGPLGVELPAEPFKSNLKTICIRCNVKITKENDSGWEKFTAESGGRETQPVCITCEEESSKNVIVSARDENGEWVGLEMLPEEAKEYEDIPLIERYMHWSSKKHITLKNED
jgi:hypothetical protein